jgi:uncharacterized protein (DUF58 family)
MAHRLLDGTLRADGVPPQAPLARGSRAVWFGDFLAPLEELEKSLLAFSRAGAGGHLVRIIDPAEEDFPYAGRTRFESPGGERSEIFGRAESVAAAYRARFKAHGEALSQLAARFGWTLMSHRTDHSPQAALIALHAALGGTIH